MNYTDYTIVGILSGLAFLVGAYFYSLVKSGDDFYVAGRRITPFTLALLVVVTNMNLFSFLGQSGWFLPGCLSSRSTRATKPSGR